MFDHDNLDIGSTTNPGQASRVSTGFQFQDYRVTNTPTIFILDQIDPSENSGSLRVTRSHRLYLDPLCLNGYQCSKVLGRCIRLDSTNRGKDNESCSCRGHQSFQNGSIWSRMKVV